MDTAEERLAEAMRVLRRQSGRSLKELERLTATSDSSLSRYVNGVATPPWSVVEALCQAVGRDPRELRGVWEDARRARLERYGRAEECATPVVGTDLVTTGPAPPALARRGMVAGLVTVLVGAAVVVAVLARARLSPASVPQPSQGVSGQRGPWSGWPT
jgi:transcriptional regulator with XRE-family HTH domain